MDLDYKATEDLTKMVAWSRDSLAYAREHGQRKSIWLLEAVRVEVQLEEALLASPMDEHLGSELRSTPERKQEQAEERKRVEQASEWKRFMQEELRELELRKGGQLARLLGEPLPEEPPAALERLASEDRRQAEVGLVALMRGGKVLYKSVGELTSEDMPARIAANRLRETWLKERRDGWLGRPRR